jgi:hypothetical protein
MSTTVDEMNTTIKTLLSGLKEAKATTSRLLRERSKLTIKLEKTEGKLAEAKKGKKKVAESSSASATETGSETGSELLTATAAAELDEMVALTALIDLVKELPKLVRAVQKEGKPAKKVKEEGAEPWTPTSASFAWRPSELYKAEWDAYKEANKAAKEAVKAEIATLEEGDERLPELKKQMRLIGSLPEFTKVCKTSTHKTDWEAFKAEFEAEHPKKGKSSAAASDEE